MEKRPLAWLDAWTRLAELVMNAEHNERRQNRRTAWILLSIVLVFFVGVVVRRWLFGG